MSRGDRVSVSHDEEVLEADGGEGRDTVNTPNATELHT